MNTDEQTKTPYRVLALKYRPHSFEQLIGQDALVRTLKNAIDTGRIAHAFMLTGVRGVGKTTTARIIAKALNYVGPDGDKNSTTPTTGPTDDCPVCQAISEDRHPDVIEMDAASRTGVDDIREILDGVRYAPTEARYKVYIIDEVHMLSKQAFNALLKTLEEPPEHVKFIFATTEIRKVPITVLSRCQRFDLRRVEPDTLIGHFENICAQENVTADQEALQLITRAADGSVRDGLSLLDQAIALGGDQVSAEQVKAMLGLGDRSKNLDVLERALTGNVAEALEIMDDLYTMGADPVVLIQDLLDVTHRLTRSKAVPDDKNALQAFSSDMNARLVDISGKLSMPTLGKTWQLLLKSLGEVQMASNPQSAAEMAIIRLAYAADLPDPKDLVKKLTSDSESGNAGSMPTQSAPTSAPSMPQSEPVALKSVASSGGGPSPSAQAQPIASIQQDVQEIEALDSLSKIVSYLDAQNEVLLSSNVYQFIHFVSYQDKEEHIRLGVRPADHAPPALTQDLAKALTKHTGKRWIISISDDAGHETLAGQDKAKADAEMDTIRKHPLVAEVFDLFPGAEITSIDEPTS